MGSDAAAATPRRDVTDPDLARLREQWAARLAAATLTMSRRREANRYLIEVAAQHPLLAGNTPNPEFRARLDRGHELYRREVAAGREVEVYVPGSRHVHRGVADDISLSSAGVTYLAAAGIPPDALHGDDLNERYKPEQGVYNSADECFVTAAYFSDGGFGGLASVVSPAQLLRKTLHYVAFGVLPQMYSVPVEEMFHSYLDEIFDKIPHVLFVDPDLQGPDSEAARELRRERQPNPDR